MYPPANKQSAKSAVNKKKTLSIYAQGLFIFYIRDLLEYTCRCLTHTCLHIDAVLLPAQCYIIMVNIEIVGIVVPCAIVCKTEYITNCIF